MSAEKASMYIKADSRWSRTADDAIAYADKYPITWKVKPLIAIGEVTEITGQPFAGKTTFVFKTVKQMREGGKILGFAVEKAHVLIWSERSVRVNGERFRELFSGESQPQVHLVTRFDEELQGKDFAKALTVVMAEAKRWGCDVVVLDTLSSLAGIQDENAAPAVQAAFALLAKAAQDYAVAIVAIHHLNKAGTSPRGSGVFMAEPTTVLEIKGEHANPRTLEIQSNLISKVPDPVTFTLNDASEYEIVNPAGSEHALQILDVLSYKVAEAKLISEVLADLELDETKRWTVKSALEALVKDGKAGWIEKPDKFRRKRKAFYRIVTVRIGEDVRT